MEEATFLTRYVNHVTIVHRRDTFRASKIMQDRARSNPKISIIMDTEVVDVLGDNETTGVLLRNVKTGEESVLPVQGLFLAMGTNRILACLRASSTWIRRDILFRLSIR